MRPRSSLCALASLVSLAACDRDPPMPSRAEHSGLFATIVAPTNVPVSEEALSHADAIISVASRALGAEPSRHRVLVFPPRNRAATPDDCPFARDYRSRCLPPHRASVVTDVLDDTNLIRGLLWRAHRGHEGFATALAAALGDPSRQVALWDGGWTSMSEREDELTQHEWPLFLQWIIHVHGVDRALRWYRSTRPGARTEDVISTFGAAINRSFHSERARFRVEGPAALHMGLWSIRAMCHGADTLTVGERIAPPDSHSYNVLRYSTAAGGAERWASAGEWRESIHRFSLSERRVVLLTTVHSDDATTEPDNEIDRLLAQYSLVSCDRFENEGGGESQHVDALSDLPRGRYALRTRVQTQRRNIEVMVSQQVGPAAPTQFRYEPARPQFTRLGRARRMPGISGPIGVELRWGHEELAPTYLSSVDPTWAVYSERGRSQTVSMRTDRWIEGPDHLRYFAMVASNAGWGERVELGVRGWNDGWGRITASICVERERRLICADEPLTERSIGLNGLVVLRAPAVSTPVEFALVGAGAWLYSGAL